jgi:hypothetical protein
MFGRPKEYHFVLTIEASTQDGVTHQFQRNNVMKWSSTEYCALMHLTTELASRHNLRPESIIILFWSFKKNKP